MLPGRPSAPLFQASACPPCHPAAPDREFCFVGGRISLEFPVRHCGYQRRKYSPIFRPFAGREYRFHGFSESIIPINESIATVSSSRRLSNIANGYSTPAWRFSNTTLYIRLEIVRSYRKHPPNEQRFPNRNIPESNRIKTVVRIRSAESLG